MKLDEFLSLFGGLSEEEFKTRFDHPFLLEKPELLADPGARRVLLVRGTRGHALSIGRGTRCHLPIRDRLVSTKHAELRPPSSDDQPWALVDLGSTNGTFVGGTQLEPHVPARLPDGSGISFGPETNFEFLERDTFWRRLEHLDTSAPVAATEDGETDLLGGTIQHGTLSTKGADAQDRPTHKRFKAIVDPKDAGDELLLVCGDRDPTPLDMGVSVVLGRKAENADVVLVDGRVSRRHAEIKRTPEGLFVRDLGSANGTFVGGRDVGPEWEPLGLGQVVTVGPFDLYVGSPQSHGTDRWGDDDQGHTIDVR